MDCLCVGEVIEAKEDLGEELANWRLAIDGVEGGDKVWFKDKGEDTIALEKEGLKSWGEGEGDWALGNGI